MTAPMTPNLDQERVERAADAAYNLPLSDGDPFGVLVYMSDYVQPGSREDMRRQAREIVTSIARAAITAYLGDTHVVVPREPTEAMLEAGEDTFVSGYTGTPTSSPEDVWKAMLSATPTVNGKGE